MRRASLAEAKAHLSELVDQAEHKKRKTLILRHGKPAAVLVPIEVGDVRPKVRTRTDQEVQAFFAAAASCGDPSFRAVDDLLDGRR